MTEMKNQPVVGRRAFVGGTLAASSLAFLAACGKKEAQTPAAGSGDGTAAAEGGTLNYYINNPVCIDPYNVQEDQGTQVEFQLFDSLMKSSSRSPARAMRLPMTPRPLPST